MAWKDTFVDYKKSGKSLEWITERLDILMWLGEIDETEKQEILTAVNAI